MRTDRAICVLVALLVGLGIVMVFSSSTIVAGEGGKFPDSLWFLRHQLLWVFLGLAAFVAAARVPLPLWKKLSLPLFALALGLLLVVLLPKIGTRWNTASRWIRVAGFGFQPSELAKLAMVLFLAQLAACSRAGPASALRAMAGPPTFGQGGGAGRQPLERRSFLLGFGAIGLAAGLILLEPDVGTAAFVGLTGFLVLFVAGARLRHLILGGLGVSLLGAILAVTLYGHVLGRVRAFWDPASDPLGKAHQLRQSLIALGSGGFWGDGLGASRQKLFYLPEQYTDSIFAVIGEELGFLGASAVLLAFFGLWICAARASLTCVDRFGSVAACGIGLLVALPAALHVAVATGCLPTKGLSLPLVSYGGSGLVVALLGLGILYRIAAEDPGSSTARKTTESRAAWAAELGRCPLGGARDE